MEWEIIEHRTGELITIIEAENYTQAEQEADCLIAETGRDREFEYDGYDIQLKDTDNS